MGRSSQMSEEPLPRRATRAPRRGWHVPACSLIALLTPAPALADDGLHGRLELQDAAQFASSGSVQAAMGDATANDALGNLRLIWEPTWGRWSLQLHYLIAAEDGPDVALEHLEEGLIAVPPPTWLNLTSTFENHGSLLATQGIDRLAVTYTTPQWVVRLGRQAITWGSGLVFRPMDLFDPFSPSATDTEYKPGVDMLYVQHLFSDGSDLQLIVAPRPERSGGAPTSDASSAALRYHTSLLGHGFTLLLARDHGDWVSGLGVNGALAGATWNLELIPTFESTGITRFSSLANISDAMTLAGRNASVFAEYFHNGFGVTGEPFDLESLPPDLLGRLVRGQVFTLRRDYLALGMTLEMSPLLTITPTLITDADDGSVFVLLAASYSLSDDRVLAGGVQAPIGGRGTEYGGLPLSATDPTRFAPPDQIYLQLRQYF